MSGKRRRHAASSPSSSTGRGNQPFAFAGVWQPGPAGSHGRERAPHPGRGRRRCGRIPRPPTGSPCPRGLGPVAGPPEAGRSRPRSRPCSLAPAGRRLAGRAGQQLCQPRRQRLPPLHRARRRPSGRASCFEPTSLDHPGTNPTRHRGRRAQGSRPTDQRAGSPIAHRFPAIPRPASSRAPAAGGWRRVSV